MLGVDIASNLVAAGNRRAQEKGLGNCRFQEGDACDLRDLDDADLCRLHTEWITLPDCQWCGERCVGDPCPEHEAACTPKGELARMPFGVPDHDEPGITRSRGL